MAVDDDITPGIDFSIIVRRIFPKGSRIVTTGRPLHDALLKATNYQPEWKKYPDCSSGCTHYNRLLGELGSEWGVCLCRKSPYFAHLVFEHQGCDCFQQTTETTHGSNVLG